MQVNTHMFTGWTKMYKEIYRCCVNKGIYSKLKLIIIDWQNFRAEFFSNNSVNETFFVITL